MSKINRFQYQKVKNFSFGINILLFANFCKLLLRSDFFDVLLEFPEMMDDYRKMIEDAFLVVSEIPEHLVAARPFMHWRLNVHALDAISSNVILRFAVQDEIIEPMPLRSLVVLIQGKY